jgi:hypothetical protein
VRVGAAILLTAIIACSLTPDSSPSLPSTATRQVVPTAVDRTLLIPAQAVKMDPDTDAAPPKVYSSDYESPVPIRGQVNTAGAEDSPFISPDGNTLYFFFTPDVNVPVQQQVVDGVTGIYMSHIENGQWGTPARVSLEEPGQAAGDGCEFVQGNVMWFCSVREGYTGVHWFTAEYADGAWTNWSLADFNPDFEVGEFHISSDGKELYFGSRRPGGEGGMDIWVSNLADETWQAPVNVSAVNTPDSEGWPALNPAGDELWFSRNFGIWRSKRVRDEWQEAELIVSPLAGEPTLDSAGNLYFVHHFFRDDVMIEADIYVAYRK